MFQIQNTSQPNQNILQFKSQTISRTINKEFGIIKQDKHKLQVQETQKKISQVIFSTFLPQLTCGGSKLSLLQDVYSTKLLAFKQEISQTGKNLTKKLFGTAIRCINFIAEEQYFTNSPNLVALSYILLRIAFQDEYVMRLIIQLLNHSQESIVKMLDNFNPYESLKINAYDLRRVFAQIILKINSLRSIFGIDEILKDYYVASETFSMFLRMVLVKLSYNHAELCLQKLQNTFEMLSILCQYFDLNVIGRKQKNHENFWGQQSSQQAQVFLFSNYNLFISTVNNHEFCMGKYYSNETQLINSQKQIRKSTFQFLLKNRSDTGKNNGKTNEISLKMEEVQMDFQMENSEMMGTNLSENTPFFNSTLSTPEFGMLFQSKKFTKSVDSEIQALLQQNMMQNQENEQEIDFQIKNLGIVEEQISSPNSEVDKFFSFKQLQRKVQGGSFQKYSEIAAKKLVPYQYALGTQDRIKSQQEIQSPNKPLSPPSIQMRKKNIESINGASGDSQSQTTLKQCQNKQNIKLKTPPQLLTISIQQSKYAGAKTVKSSDSNNIIKQISQKSVDISEPQVESLKIARKSKCTERLHIINESKQVRNFVKVEHPSQKQKSLKRKDISPRKYSVNQKIYEELKQFNKQRSYVHHSNHFTTENVQQQVPQKPNNILTNKKNQLNNNWENRSDNSFPKQKISRKKMMQLASNIVNVQVKNDEAQNKMKIQSKILAFDRLGKTYPHVQSIQSLRLNALRNSNSSKHTKSPSRSPRAYNQDVLASRHISEQYIPKAIPESFHEKLAQSKISQKVIKGREKRTNLSPRFSKANKFPQFLRNAAKNRKFMKSENLNKSRMIQQKHKNQFHKVIKLNLKQIIHPERLISSKSTNLKEIKKAYNPKEMRMRTENNITANEESSKERKKQQKQRERSNSAMKQIKSQPKLLPFLQSSLTFNNSQLLNDFHHRPWISSIKSVENQPFNEQFVTIQEEANEVRPNRQTLNLNQSKKMEESIRSVIRSQFVQQPRYNHNVVFHFSPQNSTVSNRRVQYAQPIQIIPQPQPPPLIFSCPFSYHRSSRVSNMIQVPHSQRHLIVENTERDYNPTSASSAIFSKPQAPSPSTLFPIQNQILMKQQNYRKSIWQAAFTPKN